MLYIRCLLLECNCLVEGKQICHYLKFQFYFRISSIYNLILVHLYSTKFACTSLNWKMVELEIHQTKPSLNSIKENQQPRNDDQNN